MKLAMTTPYGGHVRGVTRARGLTLGDKGFIGPPALFPVMQFSGQHPSEAGAPSIGMTLPGFVAQQQFGGSSEMSQMTWSSNYPGSKQDSQLFCRASLCHSTALVFSVLALPAEREMGRKLGLDRVLDCFSLSLCTNACDCMHSGEDEEDAIEREALLKELVKIKDFVDGAKTLAFHLEPKTVELRVSMHCYGCAKKVQKHISKMDGVTSFEVDLESKKVVVMGDITPYEVLESVSKVMKFAELWVAPDSKVAS
ncbi:hypothetical protein GUJ93_ZPchr0001g32722 [Zizania palustris]|uniref:HMA domain-containing protein n=1 Tax=Zizania palustris TaxID=103762 RepID=A0A8J5S5G2_ZIZPA|nr:hypothetical protein GUJ93_ZPchr0001g32722 [Zizania palustris]